ncbi:hypothetical protein BpHYR1_038971 [Brachionus plicatilis]|uniref:Uncharacterized protein n=1 Tax=Brachionus plicatilis TaxID=10195 RepID=A0A3M7QBT2_BRAPC|nr:hypothetical protein BpHYR1_038971 [Brachionus plicatilis]
MGALGPNGQFELVHLFLRPCRRVRWCRCRPRQPSLYAGVLLRLSLSTTEPRLSVINIKMSTTLAMMPLRMNKFLLVIRPGVINADLDDSRLNCSCLCNICCRTLTDRSLPSTVCSWASRSTTWIKLCTLFN